ncbi:uncharacterized protein LOC115374909 [Myripristis murdjan]|uniref:uncharacterized protein LOC115374909 n=1 Tax=Myripristis murdjan TaxID=586833 RepID=UPI001175CE24|nr:uncharacterized protein LOC115374909 [Myripristis murdjan]
MRRGQHAAKGLAQNKNLVTPLVLDVNVKMKNQMRPFVLLALVALLVRAQTPTEPNYEDFLFNLKFPLDNYRPLLNQVQVETLPPEEVDRSALSVRSLTFPAQETECSSTQEQGSPCPLKENGELMLCNVKVTYPVQEPSDIRAFEIRCDMATEEALLGGARTRRSTSRQFGPHACLICGVVGPRVCQQWRCHKKPTFRPGGGSTVGKFDVTKPGKNPASWKKLPGGGSLIGQINDEIITKLNNQHF